MALQKLLLVAVIAHALVAHGSVVSSIAPGEFSALVQLVFAVVVHGTAAQDKLLVVLLGVDGNAAETVG